MPIGFEGVRVTRQTEERDVCALAGRTAFDKVCYGWPMHQTELK